MLPFHVCRTYANQLSSGVLQALIDLLWKQLCLLLSALDCDLEEVKVIREAEGEVKEDISEVKDGERGGLFCPGMNTQSKVQHWEKLNGAIAVFCPESSDKSAASIEPALGDFLIFLRRVATTEKVQGKMATHRWSRLLLQIVGHRKTTGKKCSTLGCSDQHMLQFANTLHPVGLPLVGNLRTRLLALHLLEKVLPAWEPGPTDEPSKKVQ